MGWLWSTVDSAPKEKNTLTPPQSTPQPPTSQNNTPPPQALSRDDLAEQELNSFLKEINADTQAPSGKKYTRVGRSSQNDEFSSTPSSSSSSESEPLSSQLLPTTMSCRAAFDQAFYCNSFGGRWNDLYRYGTLRSCSDDWGDFWFCMRTRTYPRDQKAAAIKEHYRERERLKYAKELGRESSEDVWRSRERKVELGTAFTKRFEDFAGTDEEWRAREMERRREVDGSMG
ncbi:uncharacterized protein L3040_002503 [Drepanopeziza brunnea f. sp. 'multigermtubi']|uniref:uncharacterized protein n=1 Tax=Drepanopeziza brunnea f. sp. 'multigermtubi' TaxID=698441 RepID=UPI002389172B|nr:hypothetical protein L3040_002503 [Drepanopeziza brunnea f. sp. 'multigermtubi']